MHREMHGQMQASDDLYHSWAKVHPASMVAPLPKVTRKYNVAGWQGASGGWDTELAEVGEMGRPSPNWWPQHWYGGLATQGKAYYPYRYGPAKGLPPNTAPYDSSWELNARVYE